MEKSIKKWKYKGNWGGTYDGLYEGQWKDDAPNGLGILSLNNGDRKLKGMWKQGKVNGKVIE